MDYFFLTSSVFKCWNDFMNKNVSPPVSSSVGSLAFSVSQQSSQTEMMLSLHSDAANAVPFAGQPMTGDQCIVDGEQIDLTSIFFSPTPDVYPI